EDKIAEARSQIAEEELRKQQLSAKATEVPRERIEAIAKEGIQHYSAGLQANGEVDRLSNENAVLQRKLEHTKELYKAF
ncbi:hypothetical protein A2U01_0095441, partial [Trifolium medium]|nr:hypothetical protein [Trifolium medium]